jgi:heme/copper-type cytochrome/quinol oxidase subunit 2
VAWVGIAAVVGLVILGLWALVDVVRDRAARRSGDAPRHGRGVTVAMVTAIVVAGVLVVGIAVFLVAIDLEGTASDGSASSTHLTTTTTAPKGPHLHPPQQVRIAIVNTSGFPRPAVTLSSKLRTIGFVITGTTSAPVQPGSSIQCEEDFKIDATRLYLVLGGTAPIEPLPDPPPFDPSQVDCLIRLGR